MPRKRKSGQKGAGLGSFLSKANDWLRKSKLISKVGSTLDSAGVPWAGKVGNVAGKLGYGRKGMSGGSRMGASMSHVKF